FFWSTAARWARSSSRAVHASTRAGFVSNARVVIGGFLSFASRRARRAARGRRHSGSAAGAGHRSRPAGADHGAHVYEPRALSRAVARPDPRVRRDAGDWPARWRRNLFSAL